MERYEKYKESCVEWIGEIPENWEVKKLKYLLKNIRGGGTPSTDNPEYWVGNIPWVSPKDMKVPFIEFTEDYVSEKAIGESSTQLIESNQLLVVVRSGILKHTLPLAINTVPVALNQDMKALSTNELVDVRYMYWLFFGLSGLILNWCKKNGATVDSLDMEAFLNFNLAIPFVGAQDAIANYLDKKTSELDTLIAKKEKLIALLQEERTAIINQAVTGGLDPDVEMKDSGVDGGDRRWLGEIPAHWVVKKLKYVFDSLNTIRVPLNAEERGNMENKIYDYYGASGVIDYVDNYLFDEETILIGEDGANLLTRSKRLAFIARGKYWVNNHAHILKPKTGNIEYMCELLELLDYTEYVSGSAQPKLTQEALMSIEIFEPPVEEQNSIINFIKKELHRIDTIISKTNQEITLLKEYKTALISEVVTGKVKVV